MGKLTEKTIRAIKKDGRFSDGGGLYFVRRGGSTTWHLRWMRAGNAREMSLGAYPIMTLAEARDAALEARRAVAKGHDPIASRKVMSGRDFVSVAADFIASHRAGWRNPKHGDQWHNTLRDYAFPIIGAKSVAEVSTDDLLAILRPIWETKTETASRVRGRVEAILDFARARGWREGENPARWRGHLDHLLPARSKVAKVEHHPALPHADLPPVMARLAQSNGVAALCLRFDILTAARSAEARGARWSEIDLAARTWNVPGSRMKGGRPHRVPLSDAALEILAAARPMQTEPDGLIFPGGKIGRPLSDVALTKALKTAGGEAGSVHGMRSTFRDWASDVANYPDAVAEAALAHTNKNKVEAAYKRTDHFEQRGRLMAEWATYLIH